MMEDVQHRIQQRNRKLETRMPLITNLNLKKNSKYSQG